MKKPRGMVTFEFHACGLFKLALFDSHVDSQQNWF